MGTLLSRYTLTGRYTPALYLPMLSSMREGIYEGVIREGINARVQEGLWEVTDFAVGVPSVPAFVDGGEGFTLFAIVSNTDTKTATDTVFSLVASNGFSVSLRGDIASGGQEYYFEILTPSGTSQMPERVSIESGEVVSIQLVYNGNELVMLKNGTEVGEFAVDLSGAVFTSFESGPSTASNFPTFGRVVLFPVTLSAQEINSILKGEQELVIPVPQRYTQLDPAGTGDIQDVVGGMVSGNLEAGISVTYDQTTRKLNFNVPASGHTHVPTHEASRNYISIANGGALFFGKINVIDVSAGPVTVTGPWIFSGFTFGIMTRAGDMSVNNLTILRRGTETFMGYAEDLIIDINQAHLHFVSYDGSDWRIA